MVSGTEMKITHTYRNSQELIDIAGSFIQIYIAPRGKFVDFLRRAVNTRYDLPPNRAFDLDCAYAQLAAQPSLLRVL